MSRWATPPVGEQVEVATSDDRSYTTWVDRTDGYSISVFTPHDVLLTDIPEPGAVVSIRWHSARGRHSIESVFLGRRTDGGLQWDLETDGEVSITQDRQYVRGGGGEPVSVTRIPARPDATAVHGDVPDPRSEETVDGIVGDLSERGARVQLPETDLLPQDAVTLRVVLDGETFVLEGHVLRLLPQIEGYPVEVVVVYEPEESVAQRIRSYVLQTQMRDRRIRD